MQATPGTIDGQTMLPDLLRAAPHVRPILDRYGLRGCGGPLGPVESLRFFAHAHDVPEETLVQEIRSALGQAPATAASTPAQADLGDAIYRPFFKAGIAVVLTLGAGWGAYLLARIGFSGTFADAGLHEINGHGHAQIFGWVGLFVMGFAYQAFPRFKHASLVWPRWAFASLWLLAGGLVVRSILEPAVPSIPWLIFPVGAAVVLEIAAVLIFVLIIGATWRVSAKPLAVYDFYILSALAWFIVMVIYDGTYCLATLAAANAQELLDLVATWQGPLREIQIHGFAALMILGVSQRIFPHFYGMPAPSRKLAASALVALNLAVIGEVAGSFLMRGAGRAWGGLWYGSVVLFTVSALALVRHWHIFTAPAHPDRSLKFLRAAYVWLFASLAMLVLLPVYQAALARLAPDSAAVRIGFSHAYYGAARHAVTVGFISLMIVGVAAKVVPTLNGVDLNGLTRLWGPFLLINTGCALRVAGQILTDITPAAFPFAGVSGVLEFVGLGWWGTHLWIVMSRGPRADAPAPLQAGESIQSSHRVGDVLTSYPELLGRFWSLASRR
jgi:hypothetical protein